MIDGKANINKGLLRTFKEDVGFINHQLDSFNQFINVRVQRIIDEIREIELETPDLAEFKIKLGKVVISNPIVKEADGAVRKITPTEARMRDLTYSSPILIEMTPVINGVDQEAQEIKIGEIPIMVRSEKCTLNGMTREQMIENGEDPDDPGGYFIINGTERVIIMMEEVLSNRPIIEQKTETETARINSEANGFVQRHLIERKGGLISISFANLKKLPVVILMRALGLETDKEIIESISNNSDEVQEIYFNIYEYDIRTSEEAKEYIGKRLKIPQKEYRDKRVNDILDKYFLPHLGQTKADRRKKVEYLSKVVRKIVRLGLGNTPEQDIDHYGNKRLKMVGDFLEILFRSVLLGKYGLVSRTVYSYQKLIKRGKMPSIQSIVESDYLTKRIISHMATGQWVGGRTGVCQRLERTNFVRTIAHLRNVISPLSASQEHFEARALHSTHWGRLCCEETPEGINIGLRKYMALFAIISKEADDKSRKTVEEAAKKCEAGSAVVFMDGHIMGSISGPEKFVREIKQKRRSGLIHFHISVSYSPDFDEVYINTDSGRMLRPLIVAENGKTKLTKDIEEKLDKGETKWQELLKKGIVEYIDAEEENDLLIALREEGIVPETTHVEISPIVILGISGNLVPFPEHNRGDRVNFGAKMSGQSLGIYAANYAMRTDTKADLLIYPSRPLVTTHVGRGVQSRVHQHGQNVVLAVMSYNGYNMEDGVVFNRASVDRGMGRSYFFRTYITEEKKYWGIEKDEIKIPDKSVYGYKTEESYANLDVDGIINREVEVVGGDVLVGKISPLRFFGPVESFMSDVENRRETSETIRFGEDGIVDNVIITESSSGNKLVKVVVRTERIPELGDKFASRHGQKGVVSLIVPESDMPFTKSGITPDVVLNPHGIPSRMTVGQILEMIASKVSALTGMEIDSSAFSEEVTEESMRAMLKKLGFEDDGKEEMYDGITGRKLEARILIAPCYYQKLHHMVANKIQSRARGPVTLLTKQPTAGRAKQGGLRLGEMEKDCLIAHGTALLLKERFSSDRYKIPMCQDCGIVAVDDRNKGKRYCTLCNKGKIIDVEMSYAFKLLMDELMCMGLYPKMIIEE